MDTGDDWILSAGRTLRSVEPKERDKTARLFRLAYGSTRRGVARVVRSRTPDDVSFDPQVKVTQEDWKKQRGLLRFTISSERLTGMPLLLLVYPCLTFASNCDPRDLAKGPQKTAAEACSYFADKIRDLVTKLEIVHETRGAIDERWYWLVPMLLDLKKFPEAALAWWEKDGLSPSWAGLEGDEDDGWSRHIEQAGGSRCRFR